MIDLYAAPTSNGLRAKIMLEECELAYTQHTVDLANGAQLESRYLSLNPMGLIPTIVDSEGPDGNPLILSQSIAIMIYLSEKSNRFMPKNVSRNPVFWRDIMNIATDMTGVLMAVLAVGRMANPHLPTMDEFGARFNRYLKYWDGVLADSEFTAADEVTIADFAFYPVLYRAKAVTPQYTGGCDNVERWYSKMDARSGVQKGVDFG